jgi:Domain of unknown function (DUF4282)
MSKTCPSCGYRETDMQAQYCNKCGYPFPQNQPRKSSVAAAPASHPAPRAVKRPVRRNTGEGGFLSFGTLITKNHLKLIYLLGAAMIVLVSLMGIAGMFAKPAATGTEKTNTSFIDTKAIAEYPAGSPVFWVGFLVIGSILWRMFCELFVLLSRGHSTHGPDEENVPDVEPEEYGEEAVAVHSGGQDGQMVECPKCHKIVGLEDLRECEHCGIQGCVNCIRSMGLLKKSMTCRECFEAK